MIIGRDLLQDLGINLHFKDQTIEWDKMIIPMKPESTTVKTFYHMDDSPVVDEATQ
jgi:hypothetical protein